MNDNTQNILKWLGLIITAFATGFGAAQILFKYGVAVDSEHYIPKIEYQQIQLEKKNIRTHFLDSLAVKITIVDTDEGRDRLVMFKNITREFPYAEGIPLFKPTDQEILLSKPKILIMHYHTFGYSQNDENRIIEIIKKINEADNSTCFIIYSREFTSQTSQDEFLSHIPRQIKKNVTPIYLEYSPNEKTKNNMTIKLLEKIKLFTPQK